MAGIKSGNMEGFGGFSQFSSLEEFNHHMEMWLVEHKHDFSKGELVGLKRLVRFATKIPGVCNAKIGTILKSIHEQYHDNGISRSTFKRMILKAMGLGIITLIYDKIRGVTGTGIRSCNSIHISMNIVKFSLTGVLKEQ
ncbi:hypothetical protein [Bacillus sp. UNC41MFS5]|uniref:hypothetical protein n=1 Tax=Bacillus sp. UNC41MFS5 TaxID=1449046 RepID=UPI0006897633|nr:hypothetical protein [Bacillus sp. UNC41MFS5]